MTSPFITALQDYPRGRIALVSPAGTVAADRVHSVVETLEASGFAPLVMPHALDAHRYLAGSVEQRLEDLYAAWALDDVCAVWCLRGGYGCAQLIERLDWTRIGSAPLIGYSDISALLEAFHQHGRRAIHAPVATELALVLDSPEANQDRHDAFVSLGAALARQAGSMALRQVTGKPLPLKGRLIGGNLTTLASLAGTPAALKLTAPSILMLEDVGEAEYRLERCFYQLLNSLDPRQLAAVCLGTFERCQLSAGSASLEAIVAEWLTPLGIPLYAGAPFGHGADNQAWPYGQVGQVDRNRLHWPAAMSTEKTAMPN